MNLPQFKKNVLIGVESLLFISYCNYRVYQEIIRRNEEKEEMKLFVLEESNKIDLEKIAERASLDGSKMKSFGKKMRMLKE